MTRRSPPTSLILYGVIVLVLYVLPARAQPGQTHYIPIMGGGQPCRAGFGLEAVPGPTASVV
jgi:hypothetical protein